MRLQLEDLGLLLANLGQEAVLGERANVSINAHLSSPSTNKAVSYHLSFLLRLQLLVKLAQAGRSVVMRIGHQQGRADAGPRWACEAAPMGVAMGMRMGGVRNHLAWSRHRGIVDL